VSELDGLAAVDLFLLLEGMSIEVLLQLLVGKVDAELLEAVFLLCVALLVEATTKSEDDKEERRRRRTSKISKPKMSSTPMTVVFLPASGAERVWLTLPTIQLNMDPYIVWHRASLLSLA
jgi:hypothetical protein